MNASPHTAEVNSHADERTALEKGFPIVEVSQIAEQESWRKEINRPLYHIHKWWATRLGSVFRAITLASLSPETTNTWVNFYNNHNFSGRIVLDPFMGSGTTLGEATKLGAKAIGCDINPVSTFLVRQAFTRVSETELRSAYRRLECEVASEIRHYYRAIDPETKKTIPVLYFFWVKTVDTPDGETVPLLSRLVFAQDAYPKKKPRAQIVCINCWGIFEARYDTTRAQCPHCATTFDPQAGPANGQYVLSRTGKRHRIKDLLPKDGSPPRHRLYAVLALRPSGEKVYLAATNFDRDLFAEAERRLLEESLPLPHAHVRAGHNTDQARGYNYLRWRDFFNSRQLLCLGLLLRNILKIEDRVIQEQLLCLFSSTLEFNNLFCSYKGEGTGAVRHMFSNHILKPERTPLENSVWGTERSSGTFSTLFESRLIRAKKYLDEPFEIAFESDLLGDRARSRRVIASSPIDAPLTECWTQLQAGGTGLLVLNGDSSRLPLPDAVVDAVITDPPYFDFVHYSELSDFFFAWLAPVLHDRYSWFNREDSSSSGEVQNKDPRTFARLLGRVFAECRRVLKHDGVLAFSFHHSRPDGWGAIYEALLSAGIYVVAAHPVHSELRGASPKTAAKAPISLDAILVCRKKPLAASADACESAILREAARLAIQLEGAGMTLSSGDRFVISASQLLIYAGRHNLDATAYVQRLQVLRESIDQSDDRINRRESASARRRTASGKPEEESNVVA